MNGVEIICRHLVGLQVGDSDVCHRIAEKIMKDVEMEAACICGHPRRQHMEMVGPCCHMGVKNGNLSVTCQDCLYYEAAVR